MEKHASDALKMLSDRGISFQSSPSEFVRGSGGVSVIEKATGKMLVGFAAPSEKNLVPWLKEHTSFEVLLHKKKGLVCLSDGVDGFETSPPPPPPSFNCRWYHQEAKGET